MSFVKDLDLFQIPAVIYHVRSNSKNQREYNKFFGSYFGFCLTLVSFGLIFIYSAHEIGLILSGELDQLIVEKIKYKIDDDESI